MTASPCRAGTPRWTRGPKKALSSVWDEALPCFYGNAPAFLRHDHFHPPVFSPPGWGRVRGDRICLAVPPGRDPTRGNPVIDEEVTDGVRPALGKVEVGGLRPTAIRIAVNADAPLRLIFQDGHERIELSHGSGRRLGVVRRKEDIAQGQHQAVLGFAGLEFG